MSLSTIPGPGEFSQENIHQNNMDKKLSLPCDAGP